MPSPQTIISINGKKDDINLKNSCTKASNER